MTLHLTKTNSGGSQYSRLFIPGQYFLRQTCNGKPDQHRAIRSLNTVALYKSHMNQLQQTVLYALRRNVQNITEGVTVKLAGFPMVAGPRTVSASLVLQNPEHPDQIFANL
jgi:hypothetical protein